MGILFSIIAHQKAYEAGSMINEPENCAFTDSQQSFRVTVGSSIEKA